MENVKCLCNSKANDLILTAKDYLYGSIGDYNLVKCSSCGLYRTNPRPDMSEIANYYGKDYIPYFSSRLVNNEKNVIKIFIKKIYKSIFNFYENQTPNVMKTNLLEIGCGGGQYLSKMIDSGWSCIGIEMSEHAAKNSMAKGFDIRIGMIDDIIKTQLIGSKFDLIVGWMVLEHVHNPNKTLAQLRDLLDDNGYICISVPNINSISFKLFRKYWYPLQMPTHLYHFSQKTLNEICLKIDLKVERVFYQPILNDYPLSIGVYLKSKGLVKLSSFVNKIGDNIIFNILFYPFALLLSKLGIGSRMTVWIRKNI